MLKSISLAVLRDDDYSTVISQVLPGGWVSETDQPGLETILSQLIHAVTGVDSRQPDAILGSEMNLPLIQLTIGPAAAGAHVVEEEGGEEDFYLPGQDEGLDDWIPVPQEQFPPVQLNGEPMILIYNTHNAESYKPTDGVSRLEGKNGGVAAVSQILSRAIESKHAIKTVYCEVIHDYPDWTKSYINSRRTAQQLLKKYSKIQLVIDVHRDAGLESRADTLARIGGKPCAKVMIVVGTEHPKWQENMAFAQKLEAKANELYPGLIKCIRVRKDRRYNQDLHSRALLFEVGSDLNTREDAVNSAALLADVIAATLKGK
ncbi:MAG: stage II sporulation protein P [Peptococcaceae bacterium]|nr:stage II sporulation protein P [Peptococcaceae bacterium]MDH7524499.1 stage II sporulation protein P [Peptococcaceae bacterium]